MDSKKMFLSFIPWVAFSVLSARHGDDGATTACLVAAGLALWFAIKGSRGSSLKLIDLSGIAIFGAMAAVSAVGGTTVENHVIDFGRGGSALLLGVIMLGSTVFVPFTEQYARESVPWEFWGSPAFRAVNRRISTVWGTAVLVMGVGHVVAGLLDPASAPGAGARPIDLLLNWVVPVLLVLSAMKYTQRVSNAANTDDSDTSSSAGVRVSEVLS